MYSSHISEAERHITFLYFNVNVLNHRNADNVLITGSTGRFWS